MTITRRKLIATLAAKTAAGSIILAYPAWARGACLGGTWHLQCPHCGKIDQVDGGTCQHKCERCGTQVFAGNDVTVVCRNGHPNRITTSASCSRNSCTTSYICPTCHTECRLG